MQPRDPRTGRFIKREVAPQAAFHDPRPPFEDLNTPSAVDRLVGAVILGCLVGAAGLGWLLETLLHG